MVRYDVAQRQRAHVVSRNARRPQRKPHRQGRRSHRLRPRLPRRHLRHVRHDDQRQSSRRLQTAPPSASFTCAISRTATCIYIEPWRAKAFPVIKDLVVNRSLVRPHHRRRRFHLRLHRRRPGRQHDSRSKKQDADLAMDAAACIGCGACVAACPNAAAALFVGAKISHLGHLPQGQLERDRRALAMVRQMNVEGFANCTNIGECEAACPKEIKLEVIARTNRDYIKAAFTDRPESTATGAG